MIPTAIINRITESELSGHRIATLFHNMAEAVERMKLPGGTLMLDFLSVDDPVQEGDLIPQIHLALKRARLAAKTTPAEESEEEPGRPAPETVVENDGGM